MKNDIVYTLRDVFEKNLEVVDNKAINKKINNLIKKNYEKRIEFIVSQADKNQKICKLYQYLPDDQDILSQFDDECKNNEHKSRVLYNVTVEDLQIKEKLDRKTKYNLNLVDFKKFMLKSLPDNDIINNFSNLNKHFCKTKKITKKYLELINKDGEYVIDEQAEIEYYIMEACTLLTPQLILKYDLDRPVYAAKIIGLINPFLTYPFKLSIEYKGICYGFIKSLADMSNVIDFNLLIPYYMTNNVWTDTKDYDAENLDVLVSRVTTQKEFLNDEEYEIALDYANKLLKKYSGRKQ